jgi:glycosyltransferase involved in cell wall biosynthesis
MFDETGLQEDGGAEVARLAAVLNVRDRRMKQLRARAEAMATDMATLRASRSWRITAPLRAISTPGGRRFARRAIKLLYWLVTLQLVDRIRKRASHAVMATGSGQHVYRLIQDSGLFDADFYSDTNPEIAKAGIDPLAHYINFGAADGRDPNPLFDTSFYLESNPAVARAAINPVWHYLTKGATDGCDPNPLFDSSLYIENVTQVDASKTNPLTHYLARPDTIRGLRQLLRDGRGRLHWTDYRRQLVQSTLCYTNSRKARCADMTDTTDRPLQIRPGVIVASHDAGLFGAQLIALSVVRELVASHAADVYVLLKRGGALTQEFLALAPTVLLQDVDQSGVETDALDDLIAALRLRGVNAALCNSALSGDIAERLKKQGLTVVSAIHELPSAIRSYGTPRLIHQAHASSDHLVFPAQFVQDRVCEAFALKPRSSFVRPQGLVQANPFVGERQFARLQLEKYLRIPASAHLVMGCGFASQRKGFDLFVQVARLVTRSSPGREIHFLWVGQSDGDFTTWCLEDVANCGLKGVVHMSGPQRHPGLAYAAADVFVLPSREDPFPIVCLEAMEAGLPVVAFDSAGGVGEALGTDGGVLVPYLDVPRMADAVMALVDDPQRRSELGRMGQARIEARFQVADYVSFLLGLIDPEGRTCFEATMRRSTA